MNDVFLTKRFLYLVFMLFMFPMWLQGQLVNLVSGKAAYACLPLILLLKVKKKKKKESLCWLTFSGPPKPIKNLSNIQQRAKIWPGVSQFIHCVGANEPKLAAAYGAASQVLTRLHHSSTDMNLLMILQLKMLFFSQIRIIMLYPSLLYISYTVEKMVVGHLTL